jgi:hypothetical protein
MRSGRTLDAIQSRLEAHYGAPVPPRTTDPFALILWEQVAYLADDERRHAAFALLAERAGLTADAILAAKQTTLTEIAAHGGAIAASERAERMRESARRVVADWGGKLRTVLELPLADAKRALMINSP